MNTFVPEGADYHKGAMALDLPRLRKQLVEVQQIHMALTSGGPAHVLHHPATQMWLGHEDDLLEYGCVVYDTYLERVDKPHKSGSYCLQRQPAIVDLEVPDWVEVLAPLHRAKLFFKDNVHYAQYRDGAVDDRPRYPVTRDGKTICWVVWYAGRWYLYATPAGPARSWIESQTAWAAIQWAREHLV